MVALAECLIPLTAFQLTKLVGEHWSIGILEYRSVEKS
jgi:hypothetical protein